MSVLLYTTISVLSQHHISLVLSQLQILCTVLYSTVQYNVSKHLHNVLYCIVTSQNIMSAFTAPYILGSVTAPNIPDITQHHTVLMLSQHHTFLILSQHRTLWMLSQHHTFLMLSRHQISWVLSQHHTIVLYITVHVQYLQYFAVHYSTAL